MQLTGLVFFGHSAMNRALGYGIKRTDGIKHILESGSVSLKVLFSPMS
ncbi:hypothetical protein [Pontibacter sp. H249]